MKANLFTLVVILIIFCNCNKEKVEIPQSEKNPWLKVSNFDSNVYLRCICTAGDEIYAGTDEEIYYSDNNGNSWSFASTLDGFGLRKILVDGEDIWGGQSLMGFYHSNDKGKTWSRVTNGIPRNETIYSLCKSNNILYVGTSGSGLFRSLNNGESFEKIFECAPINEPVWTISSQGSNVVIAIPGRGVFSSNDNGITWTDISFKNNRNFNLWGLKIFNHVIYITNGPNIYKKSVFDNDWIDVTNNLIQWSWFYGIDAYNNNLIIATEYGISFSTDETITWTNFDFTVDNYLNSQFEISGNDRYIFSIGQHDVWRIEIK